MTWQFTHARGSVERYENPFAYTKVNAPTPTGTPTRTASRRSPGIDLIVPQFGRVIPGNPVPVDAVVPSRSERVPEHRIDEVAVPAGPGSIDECPGEEMAVADVAEEMTRHLIVRDQRCRRVRGLRVECEGAPTSRAHQYAGALDCTPRSRSPRSARASPCSTGDHRHRPPRGHRPAPTSSTGREGKNAPTPVAAAARRQLAWRRRLPLLLCQLEIVRTTRIASGAGNYLLPVFAGDRQLGLSGARGRRARTADEVALGHFCPP